MTDRKLLHLTIASAALIAFATFCAMGAYEFTASYRPTPPAHFVTYEGGACDIAVISVVGSLFSSEALAKAQTASDHSAAVSAEHVLEELDRAAHDPSMKGVLLSINSGGGNGGDRIANALRRFPKPNAALILTQGDSSAYEAASGAQVIIATPFSDVGDIGVTMSYVEKAGEEAQAGDRFVKLSAGKYKDAGNPDEPLSKDEQATLQQYVDREYELFVEELARNRHMPIARMQALSNGSSYLGADAVKNGLVDQLGDSETAREWFAKRIHAPAVLCKPT